MGGKGHERCVWRADGKECEKKSREHGHGDLPGKSQKLFYPHPPRTDSWTKAVFSKPYHSTRQPFPTFCRWSSNEELQQRNGPRRF